jgi:glycosyltransferase involved in cell wall biosynthesis
MVAVLSEAHVACLPSYYREGVPRVLIEAAASGRPIVTTDAPGCREIVHHDQNGLLVPVRDSGALAVALRTLVEDPAMRLRMGLNGRALVAKEFNQEYVNGATLKVYRELLADYNSSAELLRRAVQLPKTAVTAAPRAKGVAAR